MLVEAAPRAVPWVYTRRGLWNLRGGGHWCDSDHVIPLPSCHGHDVRFRIFLHIRIINLDRDGMVFKINPAVYTYF